MTDNYLGFSYRGKTLGMKLNSDFKGFIENSGNDLSFFNAPEFSNEFVVPQFGEKTVYTGNTKSNRRFELSIQLDKITLQEYKSFLEWLNLDDTGLLIFDYNNNYGFEVKVDSISNGEFHVVKEEAPTTTTPPGTTTTTTPAPCIEKYYVNLSLVFITTRDFASIWANTYNKKVFYPVPNPNPLEISLIESDSGLNFIVPGTAPQFTLFNRHNLSNYIIVEFTNNLTITGTDINVNITGSGTYYSEFGIAIDSTGKFLSCGPKPLIRLEPKSNKILNITTTGTFKIIPTSREIL